MAMASSRIFVRGLPPSLSEGDFKSHFANKYPITDVQLKPQRRIGYVGFNSADDAARAVKYFNKSFIRMSRLHVELAMTAEEAPKSRHPTSSRKNLALSSDSHTNRVDSENPLKRKRSRIESKEHVGTGPSASHTSSAAQIEQPKPDVEAQGPSPTTDSSLPHQENESKEDDVQAAEPLGPADDDHWMRSRTTRLLGLQDDDEDLPQRDVREPEDAPESEGDENENVSGGNTVVQTDGELDTQDFGTNDDPDKPANANRRLFLRNLAYTVTEEAIRNLLETFGTLVEVKAPLDFATGKSKGFAFAEFEQVEQAAEALHRLDGSIFQGRLLHVIPATAKREPKMDEFAISQLPLKKRKLIEKKQEAASSTFNWNSLYMNTDAVLSSAASRLGVSKSDLLDPTSSDAAVKQAQIETHSIQEAKKFFESHGVDLDSFGRSSRDGNALLVKNFKYDTSSDDLKRLFSASGDVTRVLMPPGGTIAIVEFPNKVQAQTALSTFAYRKYKDSVLFLERAPSDLIKAPNESTGRPNGTQAAARQRGATGPHPAPEDEEETMETSTLFVRNLSFATSSQRLHEVFSSMDGLLSGRVKTRPDPAVAGGTLSMGFGFLEFKTNEQAKDALVAMNGYMLDGHELELKASHKGLDAAAERKREDRVKRQKQRKSRLIVKNLPFEASRKDVRSLFGSYGQVKAVRLPKKFNNTSRGYAFVDFSTPQQAEKAMDLSRTHLLGRRLAIDYAEGDVDDPEKEIEKMQQKIGRQSERVALQQMAGGGRKKFVAGEAEATMDGQDE